MISLMKLSLSCVRAFVYVNVGVCVCVFSFVYHGYMCLLEGGLGLFFLFFFVVVPVCVFTA